VPSRLSLPARARRTGPAPGQSGSTTNPTQPSRDGPSFPSRFTRRRSRDGGWSSVPRARTRPATGARAHYPSDPTCYRSTPPGVCAAGCWTETRGKHLQFRPVALPQHINKRRSGSPPPGLIDPLSPPFSPSPFFLCQAEASRQYLSPPR
jgi:hypothetical protein